MKKLLTIAALCASVFAHAQSGTIVFKRTISLGEITMDGLPPEVAAMMPKEHSDEKVLHFSPDATLYENIAAKKEEQPAAMESEGIHIQFNNHVPDEKFYTDLKNKKTVQQKDLMGRQFLVKDEMKTRKWKMTGNQKKILDYPVMEATVINDGDTVTAWFTTDIAISGGPETLDGLPGMILEATINKRTTITATTVTMDAAVAAKIKEPTKGKKVSPAEYARLEKEKREEMEKEFGNPDGGFRRTVIMTN